MNNANEYINRLRWKEYKAVWSAFWFHKLGFDPNKNGIVKVGLKLPFEEVQKRDEETQEKFLNFVRNNYSK